MKLCITRKPKHLRGFTLVEVLIALFVTGIVVVATISAMNFSSVQASRDRDRGVMSDFALHYLETIRGLPFSELIAGGPINPMFDGTAGSPNVRIPTSFEWLSLSTTNYQNFHPALVGISHRTPEMRVNMTTTTDALGSPRQKQIQMELRWDAPLGSGAKQTARLDLTRIVDLN